MNIAFYAPLKPPTSPIPSGDRRVARALMAALERAGHDVELASVFRSREPSGNTLAQLRRRDLGHKLALRSLREYGKRAAAERPDLWFTYHNYYKAPDWIGPVVAGELDIPYVLAEASHAPKRAGGPWDVSHQAVAEAISGAALVFGLNSNDAGCVAPLLDNPEKLIPLRPFIETPEAVNPDRAGLAEELKISTEKPWLLTVAMMRDDAKLDSYKVLGEVVKNLNGEDYQWIIVGDGPARDQVESLLSAPGVCFIGERNGRDLDQIYAAADIFVWPAINEAYGMALLEAQAHGLPVVAGNAGGVADIVRHDATGLLVEEGDAKALATAVQSLLDDASLRRTMSARARETFAEDHRLETASQILDGALRGLVF